MTIEDVDALIKTKEYSNASKKIESMMQRLEASTDKNEIAKIRDESVAFFDLMKRSNPDLYEAFNIDHKTFAELIIKKISGKYVIMD